MLPWEVTGPVKERTRFIETYLTGRDLLTGSAHLLNVTAGPDVRVRLRIYDPFLTGDALFQVRVFDAVPEDRLVRELDVPLVRPVYEPFENWPYPLQPDSAELDIDVSGQAGKVLRIDVVPNNPALRFWTFATITNQVTSEVTPGDSMTPCTGDRQPIGSTSRAGSPRSGGLAGRPTFAAVSDRDRRKSRLLFRFHGQLHRQGPGNGSDSKRSTTASGRSITGRCCWRASTSGR